MRRMLFLAIFLAPLLAAAQAPYQCVLPGNKQYFSNDKGYLRGMRIDSAKAIGAATILYPFHTRRLRGRTVESNGGSWLGNEIRQFPNGRTEFQNYWNDTVVIETLAGSGQSWTFYSDTSSLYYTATVVQIDSASIDGTMDSVKTIRLRAMKNGTYDSSNPVSNYHILLSKKHGFREIFDLYTFPYTYPGGRALNPQSFDYFLGRNPYQQQQYSVFRPIAYQTPYFSEVNDFQPGDMFQRGHAQQEVNVDGYTVYTVVQDSITAKTVVPGGIQYTCISRSHQRQVYNDPNHPGSESYSGPASATRFYADQKIFEIDSLIMPEEGMQNFVYYYFPNDSSRCFKSAVYKRVGYLFPMPVDAPLQESATYKVGFGLTDSLGGYGGFSPSVTIYQRDLNARKAGVNCGYFSPLPVSKTAAGAAFRLYPNPAANQFTIRLESIPYHNASLEILDITGRGVRSAALHAGSNQFSTSDLPNGAYMIRIASGSSTQTERLIIAR
jgi:hypothetical protein